ncbi:MAG TPA: hypothetical protein ENK25_06615 [Bacteroidetes bacterium]|nr:hypothetical protein [Bacteroidota bacterium]
MNISYSVPLSKGWNRMKEILFHPFDIGKWFTIGFTVFLADLISGHGGRGGSSWKDHTRGVDWDAMAEFPNTAWNWLVNHIWWTGVIVFGVLFIFGLIILFNWLSSRGKFMFLDNVVHNKAEVSRPWHEYRSEGNSLFVWRLIYGLIVFSVFLLLFLLFFNMFLGIYHAGFPEAATVRTVVGIVMIFLTTIIITKYIELFLNDFVVPIMYKDRGKAARAWSVFLKLLGKHFWYFLVYGLFVFLLVIMVVLAVIAFSLMTCCVGAILLIIPYIGSVIMLPVSVTFRAFSVEFLQQFGDEFQIFPQPRKQKEAS